MQGVGFDLLFSDLEVAFPFDFEVAAIVFVADRAFIALAQLLAQAGHDGFPVMGVFAPFFLIAAHDVTARLHPDFVDFERGGVLGVLARLHAAFKGLQGGLAGHASIGHHRDLA